MKIILFLLPFFLLRAVDYDCIIIGTSPIPMCEAIYQHNSGKTVLLLEQWPELGGAWKSISVFGIPHVDMGCHQLIGATKEVKEFLETYIGCKMVFMEKPLEQCPAGALSSSIYFSKGCYELVGNLEKIVSTTSISFLTNHPVDTVYVKKDHLVVQSKDKQFSTNKIITVPNVFFKIEGIPGQSNPQYMKNYWHLYLLIQDPSFPRFSYLNYSYSGICRCMNLTHFVGLTETGRQLLVFQTYSEPQMQYRENILQDLKKKQLVSESAYILESDVYVYQQFPYYTSWYREMPKEFGEYFEILDTSTFGAMSRYTHKWGQAMKPYHELFPWENHSF